jgi:D-alanyl-D-alanine carboxypeptidase (penicillin-binding protein 5/6)
MFKRAITYLLTAAIIFAALSIAVSAEPDASLAECVYVLNVDSGLGVYEKNAEIPTPPVATAKIMTAILAYEHYAGNFDEIITVSEEAVDMTIGNSAGLKAGEEVSVDMLLTALIAGGANDAANVFALEIGGTLDNFCDMMNKKAAEIGAAGTVYKNACGIDAEGMTTTAKDVALITTYAYKLSGFREHAMITRYVSPKTNKSGERVIHNRNYLLSTHIERKYYDAEAIGMNTGFTQAGGFCTVSAAEEDGLTYITVVMNAKKDENGDNSSFYITSELIDYATENFSFRNVLDPNNLILEVPVRLGKNADYVIASPENKAQYFLNNNVDIDAEITLNTNLVSKTLTAPIHEGEKVGTVDVVYKGEVIASVDLVAKNNVNASSALRFLDYVKNLLKSTHVRVALIIFAVIFIAYLSLSYLSFVRSHKNKRK